jgi:hypothetical protein
LLLVQPLDGDFPPAVGTLKDQPLPPTADRRSNLQLRKVNFPDSSNRRIAQLFAGERLPPSVAGYAYHTSKNAQ